MRIRTTAALLVALPALAAAQVSNLAVSTPNTIVEFNVDKGQPSRLAWSADGSQLYVQTLDASFNDLALGRGVKVRHYVYTAADGSKKDVQGEPDWAREYWAAKSAQASADSAAFKIDVKQEEQIAQTTSVPRGGDLAKGGTVGGGEREVGGTGSGDAGAAAFNTQRIAVRTMVLNGETIGRFENSVIVPGLTYGWGPKGTKAIAFTAQKSGRVVLMDEQGGKKEIGGTKDAILPAWSADGKKLAWLQKDGRKKYQLQVASISSGS